jgi:hypothetical protein
MEQPVFHYTDLPNILGWGFVIKSVGQMKFVLNATKTTAVVHHNLRTFISFQYLAG